MATDQAIADVVGNDVMKKMSCRNTRSGWLTADGYPCPSVSITPNMIEAYKMEQAGYYLTKDGKWVKTPVTTPGMTPGGPAEIHVPVSPISPKLPDNNLAPSEKSKPIWPYVVGASIVLGFVGYALLKK